MNEVGAIVQVAISCKCNQTFNFYERTICNFIRYLRWDQLCQLQLGVRIFVGSFISLNVTMKRERQEIMKRVHDFTEILSFDPPTCSWWIKFDIFHLWMATLVWLASADHFHGLAEFVWMRRSDRILRCECDTRPVQLRCKLSCWCWCWWARYSREKPERTNLVRRTAYRSKTPESPKE